MGVGDQLYTPAAFSQETEPVVPIKYEAAGAPQLLWKSSMLDATDTSKAQALIPNNQQRDYVRILS
jgi:hypothetical protein